MITVQFTLNVFKQHGVKLWVGVPCSILKPLLNEAAKDEEIDYIPAVKENVAIGIASGAYLSGRKALILMQNSGLGNVVNALTSFNIMYQVPVLIVMTWRGFEMNDAPEHLIMGKVMLPILDMLNIKYRILGDDLERDVSWALEYLEENRKPVFLILKDGIIK